MKTGGEEYSAGSLELPQGEDDFVPKRGGYDVGDIGDANPDDFEMLDDIGMAVDEDDGAPQQEGVYERSPSTRYKIEEQEQDLRVRAISEEDQQGLHRRCVWECPG